MAQCCAAAQKAVSFTDASGMTGARVVDVVCTLAACDGWHHYDATYSLEFTASPPAEGAA